MLDETDQRILEALIEDSRISLKSLAELAGLSSPAVAERLRRLEKSGVIRSFTVDVDPQALGYTLKAIVRIKPFAGKMHILEKLLQSTPEICECDKVTGDDCYVARLCVRSIEHLEEILDRIGDKAETNTSIVKSQPVRRRTPPLKVKSSQKN
jgi:Lrp/AsnC family transcriptional regulator, leucine-responsive regulatory protein